MSEEPRVNQLQHLVLTRLAELGTPGSPMSLRAASRRSGNRVSFDTLADMANGKHTGRLTPRVAEGVAAGLDVPVSRVYEAAGAPRPQGRWMLPERYDRLTLEQRRLIEDLCDALLLADSRGYERGRQDD